MTKNRRRWVSGLSALAVFTAGLALEPLPSVRAAPSALDGTSTQAAQDALYAMALGPTDPVDCTHLGSSSVPFGGRTIVRGGPYDGQWMTFSGSFSLGPQTQVIPAESYLRVLGAVDVGPVTALQGTFSIGAGVTGTLTGMAPPLLYSGEQNVGACYGVGPGDAFGYVGMAHGGITGIHSWASYAATVEGQAVEGTVLFSAFQPCTENGCGGSDGPFTFAAQREPDTTPPTLEPLVLVPQPGGGSTNYIAVGDPAIVEVNAFDGESGITSSSCDPVDTLLGGLHTISCRATNGAGLTTIIQVTYVVDGNEPPVPEVITATLDEDTTVPIELYASDPDADPLTFTVTTGPTKGELTGTSPMFTYLPEADANGTDSFSYEISDGVNVVTASVAITIRPFNDNPNFTAGPDQTVPTGSGARSIPGWATDITVGPANESSQVASFVVFENSNPALFSVAPAVSPLGTLTFTAANGVTGRADITLCIQDGGDPPGAAPVQTCHDFSVTVSAPPPNLPSFVKGVDQTSNEDAGARTVVGWATSIQPGASPSVQFSVTGNTNAALFSTAPAVDAATGALTYTAAPNAFGIATITVVLSGSSGASASQSFTITVLPVNDAPTFTLPQSLAVLQGTDARSVAFVQQFSAGPPNEVGQAVRFTVDVALNPALFAVPPAISPTGVLTFTLAPNALGQAILRVRMSDDGGTANGGVDTAASSQISTIIVERVNTAPTAAAVSITTREDFSVDGRFAGRDADGDPLTYSLARAPEFGTVDLYSGQNRFTYRPVANWYGTTTFAYKVSDGRLSATAIVTVVVTPRNDPPTAYEDPPVTIVEGQPIPRMYFSDPDQQPATDYSGVIDYGNGTAPARATIAGYPIPGDYYPAIYWAESTRTYPRFGTYNATANITDRQGGSTTTVFLKVIVKDAPLYAASWSGIEGIASLNRSYGLRVACIQDDNPAGRLSDLTATISFGDGTSAVNGVVRVARPSDYCSAWPWAIVPTSPHTYRRAGTYTVTTVVTSIGGSKVTSTLKILVP